MKIDPKAKTLLKLRSYDFSGELENWIKQLGNNGEKRFIETIFNDDRFKGAIHCSSLGFPCDYRLFCELKGFPTKRSIGANLQLTFDIGTVLHSLFHYYYTTMSEENKNQSITFDYNQDVSFNPTNNPVARAFDLAGSADGVVTRELFDKELEHGLKVELLHEYKSIRSTKFHKLKNPYTMFPGYITQMHAYMACLDIYYGLLIFLSKDDSQVATYVIPFDEDIWTPIAERIAKIQSATAPGKPAPAKILNNYQCGGCPYLQVCKPHEDVASPGTSKSNPFAIMVGEDG